MKDYRFFSEDEKKFHKMLNYMESEGLVLKHALVTFQNQTSLMGLINQIL